MRAESDLGPDPELEALRARRMAELRARAEEPRGPPSVPASTGPVPLTRSSFTKFLSEHQRVVVDVWAAWCGPCRQLSPIVDELSREYAPDVSFAKVNADEEGAIAGQFGVEGIPTLLFFERGRLVDRVVGALPKAMLKQQVDRIFRLKGTGAAPEEVA